MHSSMKYKHYRNNKIYTILDKCKIQINDEWVDAIIYTDGNLKFVRSEVEFKEKFIPVKEER